jgi:hypothetical protein
MNLPVSRYQDVLCADVAMDQARGLQGDKFAEHCTGDFQDNPGWKSAVVKHQIGQRSALDPWRGGPKTPAVQAARLDRSGRAGQAFSGDDQLFQLQQQFVRVVTR